MTRKGRDVLAVRHYKQILPVEEIESLDDWQYQLLTLLEYTLCK